MATTILAVVQSKTNPEKFYEIRKGADHNVYCTCPAWKYQRKQVATRTCKHIKSYAAGQLAAKAVEDKSEAGHLLATATAKMAEAKTANALYRTMMRGGEEAKGAAKEVLAATGAGFSKNLRALALVTLVK